MDNTTGERIVRQLKRIADALEGADVNRSFADLGASANAAAGRMDRYVYPNRYPLVEGEGDHQLPTEHHEGEDTQ